MKTLIIFFKDYDKTCLVTAKWIIFNIYLRRKETLLIFFRHCVERPAKIFTWSTVIGLRLRHKQRLREIAKNDNTAWEIDITVRYSMHIGCTQIDITARVMIIGSFCK